MSRITDSEIGDRVTINSFCLISGARVADRRSDSVRSLTCARAPTVGEGAKIGNFVELKKTNARAAARRPITCRISGDATVGADVNVGAGTITCNYDGVQQARDGHRGRGVHRQRLAVGRAGDASAKARTWGPDHRSSQDVPAGALGIARGRQKNVEGWVERRRRVVGQDTARRSDRGDLIVCAESSDTSGRSRLCPSCWTDCAAWSTAATTRLASRSSAPRASRCVDLPASWPIWRIAIREEPVDGLYGVGHTRWATHGRPTEENAHPHRDCTGRIVVVHNGIIENYLELKQELQTQGHKFKTETDTEIVAHLVEREMRDDGLENAVRRALKLMRGMFAIVLVSVEDPEKIVAVRNGPPIVVGLGDNEFFVASDIPAILSHTRDVVFLGDEEMAVITRSGVEFTDYYGRAVSKTTQRVLWDPIAAEKGGHKHFMLKEIFEQPTAARDTILGRVSLEQGSDLPGGAQPPGRSLSQPSQKVTIIACGTSWHAGLVGKYLIEALARRFRSKWTTARSIAIAIRSSLATN